MLDVTVSKEERTENMIENILKVCSSKGHSRAEAYINGRIASNLAFIIEMIKEGRTIDVEGQEISISESENGNPIVVGKGEQLSVSSLIHCVNIDNDRSEKISGEQLSLISEQQLRDELSTQELQFLHRCFLQYNKIREIAILRSDEYKFEEGISHGNLGAQILGDMHLIKEAIMSELE